MQDEYKKSFDKIHMSDDRKKEMRKTLEREMASGRKPAKTTRLSGGKKAAIAAAAVAVSVTGLFLIPAARNTIYAGVRSLFSKEVPDGAVDAVEYEQQGREEREIPTDIPEAEEVIAAVSEQDRQADEYFREVTVTADYYEDLELNQLANYYAQQGCTIFDLGKDPVILCEVEGYEDKDWFSSGFRVSYSVGDNADGNFESIVAFKATNEQLQNFLDNQLAYINDQRVSHNQETVSSDQLWTKTTNDEGNIVYKASWLGPEPEVKLLPSDCARYTDYDMTYYPETQTAVCKIREGGGIG